MESDRDKVTQDDYEKYHDGITLTATTTGSQIRTYMRVRRHCWIAYKIMDENLWESFKEHFANFEVAHFALVDRDYLKKFRKLLRCGGVYVKNGTGTNLTIADTLYQVAHEASPHVWTDADIIECFSDLQAGAEIKSVIISPEGIKRFTPNSVPDSNVKPYNNPGPPPPVNPPNPEAEKALLAAKLVGEVARQYKDEMKYSGKGAFDFKLQIFQDVCNRVNFPRDHLMKAFPIMLIGQALELYYNQHLNALGYTDAVARMRAYFESSLSQCAALTEWNATTLRSITLKNPGKGMMECLQLLFTELRTLRHNLRFDLRTDLFLHNKIITACMESPACSTALVNPPGDISSLENALMSNVMIYQSQHPTETFLFTDIETPKHDYADINFTNRRFFRNNDNNNTRNQRGGPYQGLNPNYNDNYNRQRRSNGPSHQPRFQDTRNRQSSNGCWICKKPNCRSYNHTQDEQEHEKSNFRMRNQRRFTARMTGKQFDQAYDQYVLDFEGSDDIEGLTDAFDNFLVDDEDDDVYQDDNLGDNLLDYTRENSNGNYFVSVAPINTDEYDAPDDQVQVLIQELCNRTFVHELTSETPQTPQEEDVKDDIQSIFLGTTTSRYDNRQFYGIIVDTGAAGYSTAGHDQFKALQRQEPSLQIDTSAKGINAQFGIGHTTSIGSATLTTPIGKIKFHIMPCQTPFLLCVDDMNRLNVYLDNTSSEVVFKHTKKTVPVVRRFGHYFLLWNASFQSYILQSFNSNPCYLTTSELKRIHRRLGHPSVNKLHRVLERAGHDVARELIAFITKYCQQCQEFGQAPRRFKFTISDDLHFNASVLLDIFWIPKVNGRPVLHVIDEATNYQAGKFLKDMSSKCVYDTFKYCWSDSYQGPPDQATVDAGKNFISKEFRDNANLDGIKVKIVPVEAHWSIAKVERYHTVIRKAYNCIISEIPGIQPEMALQMSFKAANDSVGPDGLVPTLLVYGAYARLTKYDPPSPSIIQRSQAITKAMDEIRELAAQKLVRDALNTRNGPDISEFYALPLNSEVWVYREPGIWRGPYTLVSKQGTEGTVEIGGRLVIFRATQIKPRFVENEEVYPGNDDIPNDEDFTDDNTPASSTRSHTKAPIQSPDATPQPPNFDASKTPTTPPRRGRGRPRKDATSQLPNSNASKTSANPQRRARGRPRKIPQLVANLDAYFQTEAEQFAGSRKKELQGLIEKGVFRPAVPQELKEIERIFGHKWVDEIKIINDQPVEKSRLVIQGFNDAGKDQVLCQSPTIQRISQRILLFLQSLFPEKYELFLRDINQAYTQAKSVLNRKILFRPPPELLVLLGLTTGTILVVIKPLYGIPEAGNHWFATYHGHHIKQLRMSQSTYDPCLLYSQEPFGVVGLQTDDTLILADPTFAQLEQDELMKAQFAAKERQMLTINNPLKFNGGMIQLERGNITLTQERQCKNLKPVRKQAATSTSSRGVVRKDLTTKEQFIAQRARGAYIATTCQPEAAYDLSIAAQSTEHTDDDVKALNRRLQWQIENSGRGLRFVKLDKKSLQLLVFTDASFANNKDLSSQMGALLVAADAHGNANILHWISIKCKRVTRSVLASELLGMVHGFDTAYCVKSTIDLILNTNIPLIICTDSKSLYDCLVKLGTTHEKRLMIDVMALREAYERREIAQVKWIDGKSNPADSMTKAKPTNALKNLIDSNKLELKVQEWVERSG